MNGKTTSLFRRYIDEWLPPILRESLPFRWLTKVWLGRRAIPNFKYRAFTMTEKEYRDAYRNVAGAYKNRESDTTENQKRWLFCPHRSRKDIVGNRSGQLGADRPTFTVLSGSHSGFT